MSDKKKHRKNKSSLAFYFVKSLYVHLGLLLAILFVQWGLGFYDHFFNKDANLIQSAIRVDVVDMPEYTLKELKNLGSQKPEDPGKAPEAPAKEAPKEQDNSQIVYKMEMKRSALKDLLNKLSKKDIPPEEKEKDKKTKFAETLADLVYSGNRLSKGQQVEGKTQDKESSEIQQYGSMVRDQLRPFWRLPRRFLESNLSCQLRVIITRQGKLSRTEIFKSSGDPEFDQIAIETVKSAGPFPEPKPDIGYALQKGSLVLVFPL